MIAAYAHQLHKNARIFGLEDTTDIPVESPAPNFKIY